MKTHLKSYLHSVRLVKSNYDLIRNIIQFFTLINPILFFIIVFETITYMENNTREYILGLSLAFVAGGAIYIAIKWLINRNGWFGNLTDNDLAIEIGRKIPEISDQLLNAIQLENVVNQNTMGADLAQSAVEKMIQKTTYLSNDRITESCSSKFKLISLLSIFLPIIFFIFWAPTLSEGIDRLMHPRHDYKVPLPFSLVSMGNNHDVLGGDSAFVSIMAIGEDIPDSISLYWLTDNKQCEIKISNQDDVFSHTFYNVHQDITLWSEVKSTNWLSAWDIIQSSRDTVFVTDRPVITDILFTIIPPEYTQEISRMHQSSMTDISVLNGSRILIDATSSKVLQKAWVSINNIIVPLSVNRYSINGEFVVNGDSELIIYCEDLNDVGNNNPTHYRILSINDSPPDLFVRSPEKDITLDESMLIHFNFQTTDDYGFSSSYILYQIDYPDYLQQDSTIYRHEIEELNLIAKSQQIFHVWDLTGLNIDWEDEVNFHIYVEDNNTISGPQRAVSQLYIARYPSIEDMFMEMEAEETEAQIETEEIMMSLEDIKELVEDLKLDVLKTEEMDWEQVQKSEESLQKMEDVISEIEQLQNNLEKIAEMAENNNLVSDELKDKFSELQEILNELMTPELLEAMEEMQQAMEEMNPEKMLDALENFENNMQEFEEQLDRFLDLFKQAMAEQKMDEVVKRLEEMLTEQTDINEKLNNDSQSMDELAERELRQEKALENLQTSMDQASSALEEITKDISEQMSELMNSELMSETETMLNKAQQSMQNNNKTDSQESSSKARQNMEEMLAMAMDMKQSFQSETVEDMAKDFLKIISSALSVSQKQEMLANESKELRSRSPRLIEFAVKQDNIKRQTNQLLVQITALSRKTFYITPDIARAISKARLAMDKSILNLEQRRLGTAKSSQKSAISGLNEAILLLLKAMEEMQSSGSASGMQAMMEQLDQMSQKQQGINQGMMPMMQLGGKAQQEMMQRLQAQQQKLQQQLSEMLSDKPGESNGGLGKAEKEMQEVLEDFRRKRVNQRTLDKQERILSRMLDSQKSLTQRDYSEKRKSNTGSEIEYTGPGSLPADYGERELLLIKAMEEALNEGYSREYNEMMKIYFRKLQQLRDVEDE
jgi:hypothetical protein